MIEAVENHMPETIIIDEIGTELEALAASTIAQRGVQLVGTAHGITIDNIIKNPSLQILVGGIEVIYFFQYFLFSFLLKICKNYGKDCCSALGDGFHEHCCTSSWSSLSERNGLH